MGFISQNDAYNFSLLSSKVLFVSAKLLPDSKAKPADRIDGFCFIIALNCDIKLQHTAALNGVALRRGYFVRHRRSSRLQL